jgi:hypothetical protein
MARGEVKMSRRSLSGSGALVQAAEQAVSQAGDRINTLCPGAAS